MTRHPSAIAAVGLVVMALVLVVTAASSVAAPILPPLKFAVVVTEVRRGRCDGVLAELHSLSEEPGPTGGRASYLLAPCLLQQGDIVAARREFDEGGKHFPPLGDHAPPYSGQAAVPIGPREG